MVIIRNMNELRKIRRLVDKLINDMENDSAVDFLGNPSRQDLQLLTIESFIQDKVGLFESDLMTAKDMVETLTDERYASYLHVNADNFTPMKVGKMFKKLIDKGIDHGNRSRCTAYNPAGNQRMLILRDSARYNTMSASMVYNEYQVQIEQCRYNNENTQQTAN